MRAQHLSPAGASQPLGRELVENTDALDSDLVGLECDEDIYFFNKLLFWETEPQTFPQLRTWVFGASFLPPYYTPLPDAVRLLLAPSGILTLLGLRGEARECPREFRGPQRWLVLGRAHLPGLVRLPGPSLLPGGPYQGHCDPPLTRGHVRNSGP